MNNITQIDLLRHGKLETSGLFCAQATEAVNKQGMQDLIQTTRNGKWDVIISSPFLRCCEFAQQLSEQSNTQLIIDNAFQEMDFGDWVGKKNDELWQQDKTSFEQLWQSPATFIAPNGESMADFSKRVQRGVEQITSQYENQSILLITHAGVIRNILAAALEISYLSTLKFDIAYAKINRLHRYPDNLFSLKSLGVIS